MKHIFLIIGLVSVLTFPAEAKGRPTVISAEIYGYVRDSPIHPVTFGGEFLFHGFIGGGQVFFLLFIQVHSSLLCQ